MLLANSLSPLADSLGRFLFELFGGDYPVDPLKLHQIAARAIVVYVIGVVIVRVGKSRILSRVTNVDVIIGFLLGSLLGRGITGHASLSGTALASAVLVFVHWLFTAVACRWHWFGTLIKGHSYVIVKDGEANERAMLHSHISQHDLDEELRLKGVEDMKEVYLAFKERNGEVSVIRQKPSPHVLDITVLEGVQTVRIEIGGQPQS